MDNVVNLSRLKEYNQRIKDLETCISMIDLNVKSFRSYIKYKPISEIYSLMETSKNILEIHLNKYKRAVANEKKDS